MHSIELDSKLFTSKYSGWAAHLDMSPFTLQTAVAGLGVAPT